MTYVSPWNTLSTQKKATAKTMGNQIVLQNNICHFSMDEILMEMLMVITTLIMAEFVSHIMIMTLQTPATSTFKDNDDDNNLDRQLLFYSL